MMVSGQHAANSTDLSNASYMTSFALGDVQDSNQVYAKPATHV